MASRRQPRLTVAPTDHTPGATPAQRSARPYGAAASRTGTPIPQQAGPQRSDQERSAARPRGRVASLSTRGGHWFDGMQMVCLPRCPERACLLRVGGAHCTALFVHLCVRTHIRQWPLRSRPIDGLGSQKTPFGFGRGKSIGYPWFLAVGLLTLGWQAGTPARFRQTEAVILQESEIHEPPRA